MDSHARARPGADGALTLEAQALARGVSRWLGQQGWRTLTEFTLASGRRADVIGIDDAGRFLIVEIKTSAGDYRSDRKWREYLDYCDWFAFAVPETFPTVLLPPEVGLLIADAWEALSTRPAMPAPRPMPPARRRQLLIRFGRVAAERLIRLADPAPDLPA